SQSPGVRINRRYHFIGHAADQHISRGRLQVISDDITHRPPNRHWWPRPSDERAAGAARDPNAAIHPSRAGSLDHCRADANATALRRGAQRVEPGHTVWARHRAEPPAPSVLHLAAAIADAGQVSSAGRMPGVLWRLRLSWLTQHPE